MEWCWIHLKLRHNVGLQENGGDIPLLVRDELFVPPDDVELAEGDVVISIELRPPETI